MKLLSFILSLAVAGTLTAEPAALRKALVFAGTSVQTNGQHWAYLVWQPGDDSLLEGRTLALYRKAGTPDAVANYELETVLTGSWDARIAASVLGRSTKVGQDLAELESALHSTFNELLPPSTAALSDKALYCIQAAQDNEELRGHVGFLARAHPGMAMLLGRAHVSPLPGNGQTVTYELRDYDSAKRMDLGVVGRATVTAGQPLVLPRPGAPAKVNRLPGTEARTHLAARLRWATPENLRGLAMMQSGFNVYRVERAAAEAGGFSLQTPSMSQLFGVGAIRVNARPVIPEDDLNQGQVDAAEDLTTVHFIDDNDALQGGARLHDGAEYYYFITARDLLGRDGLPSPAGLARICDEMPPLPPSKVSATPVYRFSAGVGYHHFRVSWRDSGLRLSDRPGEEALGGFYVYRWDSVESMNTYSVLVNPANGAFVARPGLPAPADVVGKLVAIVPYAAGQVTYSFDDLNGPHSPDDNGKSYVYTVRCYDNGACGRNVSGDSGAGIGNLLDLGLSGSAAGLGSVLLYSSLEPTLTVQNPFEVPGAAVDPALWDLQLECSTGEGDIASVADFEWPAGTLLARVAFVPGAVAGQRVARKRVRIAYNAALGTPVCRVQLSTGKTVAKGALPLGLKPTSGYKQVPWTLSVEREDHQLGGGFNGPHVPDADPSPEPGDLIGARRVGPKIHLALPAGTAHWRLYRQVDDGEKMLIAHGSGADQASVDVADDKPPVNNCRLCYYQQTFDAQNRPSEMMLISCILHRTPGCLPQPVITQVVNAKTSTGQPAMRIQWRCPPHSVERFLLELSTNGTQPGEAFDIFSANLLPPGVEADTVNFFLSVHQTQRLTTLPGYPRSDFSAVVPVVQGQDYRVKLTAVGPGEFGQRPMGQLSGTAFFTWSDLDSTGNGDAITGEPVDPSVTAPGGNGGAVANGTLPWPARPLPAKLAEDNRFHLRQKFAPQSVVNFDERFGPMIRVGAAAFTLSSLEPTINDEGDDTTSKIEQSFDPRLILYPGVLPCVLYRRQADHADAAVRVPVGAKRDWIQVTPLIEDIAYEAASAQNQQRTIIHDPWFAMPSPPTGDAPAELYLVDRHPVVRGHAYEYALVLFDRVTMEPKATQPVGIITVK
jgi:hypothetical protein